MLDIKLLRENAELVKENIRKKFQDSKLSLVDEVVELDKMFRDAKTKADELRGVRNSKSKEIGALMQQGLKEKAEETKKAIANIGEDIKALEEKEVELETKIKNIMLTIPNIIDNSVPIGKDDSENVEVERFGEATIPTFEIPYHTDIMEN